jgi:hypothetical protein
MTEPQTITPDHVRTLLAADDGAASLVLIEVLAADRLGTEEYLGAFEVASRDELTERLGADPSDDDIATEAAGLSTSVQQIGG